LKQKIENENVKRVAIAILHYLQEHPMAKDSAEGIAKWWVSEEQALVKKALEFLVKTGIVEKRGDLYRLATNKLQPERSSLLNKTLRRLQRKK
jgi:hypothetical protein